MLPPQLLEIVAQKGQPLFCKHSPLMVCFPHLQQKHIVLSNYTGFTILLVGGNGGDHTVRNDTIFTGSIPSK